MNISVYNPAPTYIIIDDIITPELAQHMMDVVDVLGTDSNYTGNRNTLERRLQPYMHRGFIAGTAEDRKEVEIIAELSRITSSLTSYIADVFKNSALDTITGHRGFWLMKYGPGGEFEEHVDWSTDDDKQSTPAVATLCIKLNDEYTGGTTLINGSPIDVPQYGGAIWDGWTYHTAEPVEEGDRYVCVIHFLGTLKV